MTHASLFSRIFRILFFLSVLDALWRVDLVAGGFQINQHSARATAMGGTLAAMTNDVTSICLNPAALSFLRGTHFSIGTTVMMPDYRFTGVSPSTGTTKAQSQVLFPPNFYLTHTFGNGMGIGIATTIPFASRNEWDQNWVGGRIVTRSELRAVNVSPSISFALSRSFSVGASLNVISSRLSLSRRIGWELLPGQVDAPDGVESLEGTPSTAYGFQLGALVKPVSTLSMALTYRSSVKLKVTDGKASYGDIPAQLKTSFPDAQVSTTMTLPDNIRGGLGWQPFSWLYVEGDLEYALWSSSKRVDITYSDVALSSNPALHNSIVMDWRNTLGANCGIELEVLGALFRGGYQWGQSPASDARISPSLPDANQEGYSVGLGYSVSEGLDLDFAYMFIRYRDRRVTDSLVEYKPGGYFNGTYQSSLTVLGINVSYSWN